MIKPDSSSDASVITTSCHVNEGGAVPMEGGRGPGHDEAQT